MNTAAFPHGTVLALLQSQNVEDAIRGAWRHAIPTTLQLVVSLIDVPDLNRPPLAVIMEMSAEEDETSVMERLTTISKICDEKTIVFVVGHQNDIRLSHRLREVGVTDYYVTPLSQNDIVKMLSTHLATSANRDIGELIAVMNTRGGAGATTVAVNIAWQLAHDRKESTCLVDLDLPFGGIATELDLQPDESLSSALYQPEVITDVNGLDQLVLRKADLSVICAAPNLSNHFTTNGLDRFVDLIRSQYRNTVLDLPLRWNPAIEALLATATRVVLVTTPDFAGIPPAQILLRHLFQMGIDPIIVINHVTPQSQRDWPIDKLRQALRVPDIYPIPASTIFRLNTGQGRPVSADNADHSPRRAMKDVVAALRTQAQPSTQPNEISTSHPSIFKRAASVLTSLKRRPK